MQQREIRFPFTGFQIIRVFSKFYISRFDTLRIGKNFRIRCNKGLRELLNYMNVVKINLREGMLDPVSVGVNFRIPLNNKLYELLNGMGVLTYNACRSNGMDTLARWVFEAGTLLMLKGPNRGSLIIDW